MYLHINKEFQGFRLKKRDKLVTQDKLILLKKLLKMTNFQNIKNELLQETGVPGENHQPTANH